MAEPPWHSVLLLAAIALVSHERSAALATARGLTFADLLRRHRLAAGLSQDALAQRTGLSRTGVRELERDLNRPPHQDTVERLAAASGLDAPERMRLTSSPPLQVVTPAAGCRPPIVLARKYAGAAAPEPYVMHVAVHILMHTSHIHTSHPWQSPETCAQVRGIRAIMAKRPAPRLHPTAWCVWSRWSHWEEQAL
jgi:transcriptional regulator with XRE-family HTH domain